MSLAGQLAASVLGSPRPRRAFLAMEGKVENLAFSVLSASTVDEVGTGKGVDRLE
jgi:hypothetical protein